jgi:hypothetical protein
MSDQWTPNLDDPDFGNSVLEAQLHDLASHLSWPATPDVAASAADHLRDHPASKASQNRRRARLLLAAAVVVAVLAASLAAFPSTRRAVADLLGLRGVRISTDHAPAIPSTTIPSTAIPTTTRLNLGRPVTLAEASRRVGFAVRLPKLAGFAQPDGVYVNTPPPNGAVTLTYRPQADLPAAAQTGVGLLLTEFRATIEAGFFGKVAEPGTTIEALSVHGQPAYWLSGAPHAFFYQTPNGDVFPDTLRLATNTLVWQAGDVTLRVEGQISRDRALAIATSLP